jgi:hypothetical protein
MCQRYCCATPNCSSVVLNYVDQVQPPSSRSHAPLYTLYSESLRKYTRWCVSDFTAAGGNLKFTGLTQNLGRL